MRRDMLRERAGREPQRGGFVAGSGRVVVVGLWALAMLAAGQPGLAGYTPSPPISIDGTAQLRQYASQGDGSPAKPFVVQGLRVSGDRSSHCIEIRNVSDHFVVRDCWFERATEAAIVLSNVRNAWVVDCVIADSGIGVACVGGTRGVVFTGNSFRDNAADAYLAGSSASWDDGYLGNYWSGYRGADGNSDGIGDTPYTLKLKTAVGGEAGLDRFPLLEAIAGAPPREGHVLLRVSYTAGDVIELRSSAEIRVTTVVLIFPTVVEALIEQRIRQRVLTSPGTGFFTLDEALLEDAGTITEDGVPQPYQSSAGTSTIRRTHRLGVMTEPGHGMLSAEMAGVDITAQLPARHVTVGDRWTASWTTSAAALGWESGEQRTTATFLLASLELVSGDLCAVIQAEAKVTSSGRQRDPMWGVVSILGEGILRTTAHFSLVRGRIVRQSLTGTLEMKASASGFVVLRQRIELTAAADEVIPGTEPETAVPGTPLPGELVRALALLVSGDFAGAEEAARRAAELFRMAGQTEHETNALWLMGDAQMRQEKYREAVGTFEAALLLYQMIGIPRDEAACLNSLGLCHRRLGEHEIALGYYRRVVDLAAEDPALRSTGLVNMGICLTALGDYVEAIARLEEARRFRAGRDVTGEINALNSIAICHRKLGQYEKAHERYDQALALFDSTVPQLHRATVLGNKGSCFAEQGHLDQALVWLLEAQRVASESGDRLQEAGAWVRIGMCQQRQGKPEAAMASLERALGLSRTSDIVGNVSYWRGWCFLDLGDPASARTHFEAAKEWAREGGDLELLWRIEWGLALSWCGIEERPRAKSAFEAALGLVEKARRLIADETTRTDYFRSVQKLFQDYADFLYSSGQMRQMLGIAERFRARTLLDLLAQGPVGTLANVADEGIRTGVVEASVIEADLWEVVGDLPEDTVVLEYFTTEKAVYLWAITRGEVSDPIRIEVDRDVLLARVLAFRQAIETQPERGKEADALLDLLSKARDLYDLLLSPVEAKIAGYARLVVIPSGPLHYLPFAALYDCPGCEERALLGGTYLIERSTVSYLPSLTTLKYAQAKRLAAEAEPTIFALGDPDSGNPDYRRLPGAQAEVRAIARLFTPPPEPVVVLGTDASQTALRQGGTGARHVMLSTHGVFNPLNPMFSYLLMAPSEEDDAKLLTHEVFGLGLRADLVTLSACETLLPSLRDAERQVRAVRGTTEDDTVRLPPELLERITAGDELVGLTRAFIYAGTPTVLSTLWSVYDDSTRHLMVAFYRKLLEGRTDKAEALRQAQLLLLRDPIYRHPVHWAAFTLYGDWR